MSRLYDAVKDEIAAFRADLKEKMGDGKLSVDEAARATFQLVGGVLDIVTHVADHSPEDRKVCVMEAFSDFYDEVIAPQNIPWVPDAFEPKVDALVKRALEPFVSAAYDYICEFVCSLDESKRSLLIG